MSEAEMTEGRKSNGGSVRGSERRRFRARSTATALTLAVCAAGCVASDAEAEEEGEAARLGTTSQAFKAGESLRGVVTAQYGEDVNRFVPDLVRQFKTLLDHGEHRGFYTKEGYPDTKCGGWFNSDCYDHWQGLVRLTYPVDARRYFLAASSHENKGSYIASVPTGTVSYSGLGSNRKHPSKPDWNVAPPAADTMKDFIRLESQPLDHPGGMQTIGRYVAVAMEEVKKSTPGAVALLDVGEMNTTNAKPKLLWKMGIEDEMVATAAIVKLRPLNGETQSRFLMITAGAESKKLTFNISRAGYALSDPKAFSPTSVTTAEGTLTPSSSIWTTRYQTIQVFTDSGGKLYLLAAKSTESTSGTDWLDLFELNVTLTGESNPEEGTPKVTASLVKLANHKMWCSNSISDERNCDFAAAGSAYVDPDGRLYFYATVHSDDKLAGASTQWTRMVEFRPRDHLDNPSTPWREGCTSLGKSWVSLIDGPLTDVDGELMPQGKNILFIEYMARHHRAYDGRYGYSSFEKAFNFDNRVQSVQYCLAPGAKFRLFQHPGRTGTFVDLEGNGTLQSKQWSSKQNFSSACFLDAAGLCH